MYKLLKYSICIVTAFKTDFVTTPNGWTARIRADAQVSSHTLVSFFYYVFNEGLGTMDFTFTNNKAKIYGYTPEVSVHVSHI